ncbi:MarR family winged helix-turn-helix transcriptional regulator [Streptomyces profundus]|uniref:MarR family winged helix-turn-helix transcriptional regulator n=1 Tax=Streptomyces profundus TaxID=2867410 RepID=UPI001D161415|nr:MarR family winged helix-turn-helix transcriptional regulator [Streptomyces sp. MA3_2.13]UED84555.1 MarR family winged helix-turn-helix transcriptional regulator [Streptomyces sp. MA3_2.13]
MNDPGPPLPSSAREGRLSHAVFQLARAHRSRAAAMLRAMDLHPGQELLLMRLFDKDGQPQSELLGSVGLDHSTVSKSLRRMRDAGLLTREPAAHDRRAAVIWLTEKGRALREPLTAMWRTLEEASVRDLSPEEVDAFIDIAHRIEGAVGDRDRPPPP